MNKNFKEIDIMSIIVGIHRQRYTGNIEKVKLDTGEILDMPEAIQAVKDAKIEGVTWAVSRNGEPHLRSKRDDDTDNNLDNLPEF